jgi:hypothetical protein
MTSVGMNFERLVNIAPSQAITMHRDLSFSGEASVLAKANIASN